MQIIDWQPAVNALEANPLVVAAWVFGSAQDGQLRPGSDIDIGVLLSKRPTFEELTDLIGD